MWLSILLLLGTATYGAYGGIPRQPDPGLGAQPGGVSGIVDGAVGVGAADMGGVGAAGGAVEFGAVGVMDGPGGAAAVGVDRSAMRLDAAAPVDGGVDLGGAAMMDGGGAMMDGGGAMMDGGGAMMDGGGAMMDGGGAMMDGGGAMMDGMGPGGQTGDQVGFGGGVGPVDPALGVGVGVGPPGPGVGRPPLGGDPSLIYEEATRPPLSPEQIERNKECAARCYVGLCYFPHDTDCRRFTMCERQADRMYHGTEKYCGHGTFFSGGKTTCALPADAKCPKDPCRIPANDGGAYSHIVKTSDNRELPSCKQYWKCENLFSVPMCCADGLHYNTATGTCERPKGRPQCAPGACIEPDMCKTHEFTSYPMDDNNCLTHWACVGETPQPSCCLAGERYNPSSRQCEKYGPGRPCQDTCPEKYDSCLSGKEQYKLILGRDMEHCRTYIRCILEPGNTIPLPQRRCCRLGFEFDSLSNECKPSTNMLCDPSCPDHFIEDCHLYAIEGKPNFYREEDHGRFLERPCPPGSVFSREKCGCGDYVETIIDNSCNLEVDIQFHFKPYMNYGSQNMVKVEQFGEARPGSELNNQTTYYFNGTLRYNIDFFRQSWPKLFLHVDYRPETAATGERMILVSNCRQSGAGLGVADPSLEVTLENGQVVFRAQTPKDQVELRTPYTPGTWNQFKAYYDGTKVVITNQDALPGSQLQRDIGQMNGNINVAEEGLEIGLCKKRGARVGYKGDISKGLKDEFETAVVNEPSVFEPLQFYCTWTPGHSAPFPDLVALFYNRKITMSSVVLNLYN